MGYPVGSKAFSPAALIPVSFRAELAVRTSGRPGWEPLFPLQPTPDFPAEPCHPLVPQRRHALATSTSTPSAPDAPQADTCDTVTQSKAAGNDGNGGTSNPNYAKPSGNEERGRRSGMGKPDAERTRSCWARMISRWVQRKRVCGMAAYNAPRMLVYRARARLSQKAKASDLEAGTRISISSLPVQTVCGRYVQYL